MSSSYSLRITSDIYQVENINSVLSISPTKELGKECCDNLWRPR